MKPVLSMLLLLSVVGCSDEATQVIVTIDADPAVQGASSRLHVVVMGGASGTAPPMSPRLDQILRPGNGDPAYPFTIALAPLEGDSGRSFGVTITAEAEPSELVGQARLIGTYVEGRTVHVTIRLDDACINIVCGTTQTCENGVCLDARWHQSGDAGPAEDADMPIDMPESDGGHDAGSDAGPVDAGPGDAGPVDTGIHDLGPTDAGTPDLGPADAGGCAVYRPYTWNVEYRPNTALSVGDLCSALPTRTARASTASDLFAACLSGCSCSVTASTCEVRRTMTCATSMSTTEEAYDFGLSDTTFTGRRTWRYAARVCVSDIIGTWVSP